MSSEPSRRCLNMAKSTPRFSCLDVSHLRFGFPVAVFAKPEGSVPLLLPRLARSFRSLMKLTLKNGSCERRQPTAADGKLPQRLLAPNLDEPSRRIVRDAR